MILIYHCMCVMILIYHCMCVMILLRMTGIREQILIGLWMTSQKNCPGGVDLWQNQALPQDNPDPGKIQKQHKSLLELLNQLEAYGPLDKIQVCSIQQNLLLSYSPQKDPHDLPISVWTDIRKATQW